MRSIGSRENDHFYTEHCVYFPFMVGLVPHWQPMIVFIFLSMGINYSIGRQFTIEGRD